MSDEVAVLRAMAEVSEMFVRLAVRLRSRGDVRRATHLFALRAEEQLGEDHFRVGSGAGFRMEWYAEAELDDGRDLSFAQEVAWHGGEWVVDASVRSVDHIGEEVVLELPRRFAIDAGEVAGELIGQSLLLESRYGEALRRVGLD